MQPLRQPPSHTFDVLQVIFTGMGVLTLWGVAVIFLVLNIVSGPQPGTMSGQTDPLNIAAIFASFITLGIVLLPGIILPLRSIAGKTPPAPMYAIRRWYWIVLLVWPILLVSGVASMKLAGVNLLLFPVIHVLTVIIPILLILGLAIRGIEFKSHQRIAGLTMTGMIGGTTLSLILETITLLSLGIILLVLIFLNPAWLAELNQLAGRLMIVTDDLEALQQILLPYLSRPAVIGVVLIIVSGFIPLIEELSKTIGFWFLYRKEWTLADGYIGGLCSGAGFAVAESLLASAQMSGETWLVVVITRVGTALMHILASGLVGMGFVYAWKNRQYIKMVFFYLGAVLIHGFWNLLAVALASGQLVKSPTGFLSIVGVISPYLLGVLSFGALAGLLALNRYFRLDTNHGSKVSAKAEPGL